MLNHVVVPKVELHKVTMEEAIELLRHQFAALRAPEEPDPSRRGVNIVLDMNNASVAPNTVFDFTIENASFAKVLHKVAAVEGMKARINGYGVMIFTPDKSRRRDALPEIQGVDENETITLKLMRIIIPRVEFREATVDEALKLLQKMSVELDMTVTDPSLKGLSLKLHGGAPARRITFSAGNLPIGEVIQYIAELADLKIKIENGGLVLYPAK